MTPIYSVSINLALSAVGLATFCLLYCESVGAIDPPDCTQAVYIRWAASSDRLYIENAARAKAELNTTVPTSGGGCTNLTAIVEARTDSWDGNKGPVYYFDKEANTIAENWTGDFFINSSVYIEDNVLLDISSPTYGGDVNRLFLRSDATKIITMRAHGGRLSFNGVKVRSLDRSANFGLGGPDTNVTDGRSFITAISEVVTDETLNCSGMAMNTMGEARLDIHDCSFGYLGYYASESYGLTYKVRGLCSDNRNLEILDEVAVWGDITDSEIMYQYFGHYSYGHQGGNWSGNHVHHNIGYGFDPHDDSDYVTISNNHVHHNGWHGIIASKRCDHAVIEGNLVHDNGYNGIMLHRSCDYAIIANNNAYNNGDAGVALYESSNVLVHNNNLHDNMNVAIRLSMGSSNNHVYNNTLNATDSGTNRYSIYMYRGTDIPGVPGSDGRPLDNCFSNNDICSRDETAKIVDTVNTTFEDNYFSGEFTRLRNSMGVTWTSNWVEGTYALRLEGTSCFVQGSAAIFKPVCSN